MSEKKRKWRNEKGIMSLVEIVVIVAILCILVAATVVSWRGAKARAMIRLSCSALMNVRNGMHGYWSDNDEYPYGVTSFSGLYTVLSASGLDTDPTDSFLANSFSYSMVSDTYTAGIDYYTLAAKAKGPRNVVLTVTPDAVYANDGKDFSDLCK